MRTTTKSLIASLLLAPLLAAPVAAQAVRPDSGFHLRVGGDIAVAAGEREGGIVVLRGDAHVAGTVGTVIVIEGTAWIDSGRVGELIVILGRARLADGAVVTGDVHLLDAEIEQAARSRVEGRIERGVGRRAAGEFFAIIAIIGLGVFAALVVAGVLVALVAPDGLMATGRLIRTDTAHVAGAAALLWLAGPVIALLLVPTLIGLPLGLGYVVFVMPTLGLVGLIVAGGWVGAELLRRIGRDAAAVHPVSAAIAGIIVLLLVGRLPVLGLVSTVLTMLGAGAAMLVAVRAARRTRSAAGPSPSAPLGG